MLLAVLALIVTLCASIAPPCTLDGKVESVSAGSQTLNYVRNGARMLTQVQSGTGLNLACVVGRDGAGRATDIKTGSGCGAGAARQQRTYDALGRVEQLTTTSMTGDVEVRATAYDWQGRADLVEVAFNSTPTEALDYEYSVEGWLTQESRSVATGSGWATSLREHSYDEAGNRLSTTVDSVVEHSWAYDPGNLLATIDGDPVEFNAQGEMEWDPRGYEVMRNPDGSEFEVNDPAASVGYRFLRDPFGDPIGRNDGADDRRQLWGNPQADLPRLQIDESGVLSLNVAVEGVQMGRLSSTAYTPVVADTLGTVVLDGSTFLGVPEAFGAGANLAAVGATQQHLFAGLESMPDLPFQLSRARLYDPTVGRFTSVDPIGLQGGDHRFMYAENQPTGLVDPGGLSAESVAMGSVRRDVGEDRRIWGRQWAKGESALAKAKQENPGCWNKMDCHYGTGGPGGGSGEDPARFVQMTTRDMLPGERGLYGSGDFKAPVVRGNSGGGSGGDPGDTMLGKVADILASLDVSSGDAAPAGDGAGPTEPPSSGGGGGDLAGARSMGEDAFSSLDSYVGPALEGVFGGLDEFATSQVEGTLMGIESGVETYMSWTPADALSRGDIVGAYKNGFLLWPRIQGALVSGAVSTAANGVVAVNRVQWLSPLDTYDALTSKNADTWRSMTVQRANDAMAVADAYAMASILRSPGGGGTGGGGPGGGGGGSCFAGDTPVLTAEGWKPIGELRAGDLVWSCDEETGDDCTWRRVQRVLVHRDAEVWRLEVAQANGELVVVDITLNHPVYVAGLGWAEAGTLEVGDALVGADGEQLAVVGLWPLREGELVWNLTVAVGHTYFVGEGDGVWVHNKGGRKRGPRGAPRVTEAGLSRVEAHLSHLGALDEPANAAMLRRLRAGKTTQHDISFYTHELKESAVLRRTAVSDPYDAARAAHLETLEWQGIDYAPGYEAQLYHPEVISMYSEYFNPAAWPK